MGAGVGGGDWDVGGWVGGWVGYSVVPLGIELTGLVVRNILKSHTYVSVLLVIYVQVQLAAA